MIRLIISTIKYFQFTKYNSFFYNDDKEVWTQDIRYNASYPNYITRSTQGVHKIHYIALPLKLNYKIKNHINNDKKRCTINIKIDD